MIKLSRMADYGVVLMTQFARDAGQLKTASDMAATSGLPVPTVSKILKRLVQEGLLESHRGIKGGYMLAREPGEVSMADIIGAVDGPIALTECMSGDGLICEIEALCPTRTNWKKINDVLTAALASVSLAEMAGPIERFAPWTAEPAGVSVAGAAK